MSDRKCGTLTYSMMIYFIERIIMSNLQAKVDIDRLTSKRYTPLHLACHQGHIATAKLLVEACKYMYRLFQNIRILYVNCL